MAQNLIELNLSNAIDGLAAIGPTLNSAAGRFARDLKKANGRLSRAGPGGRMARLPGPPVGRVRGLAIREPRRLRTQIPTTVVARQRFLEALRRGGPPPLEAAVQAGAQQVADAIRSRLLSFRGGLQGLERRLQTGTSLLQATVGTARRAPPSGTGETLVAAVALLVSAFVTAGVLTSHAAAFNVSALFPRQAITSSASDLETRVNTVAHAIAVAEGYYARGEHDGHSLPFMLNNPGSLKRPALGGEKLDTWKESGLLVFPSEMAGWTALKHQVRLMLSGQSSVYRLSDKISDVASKYADGDSNWGINVARELHISPTITLAEIFAPPNQTRIPQSLRALALMTTKQPSAD